MIGGRTIFIFNICFLIICLFLFFLDKRHKLLQEFDFGRCRFTADSEPKSQRIYNTFFCNLTLT